MGINMKKKVVSYLLTLVMFLSVFSPMNIANAAQVSSNPNGNSDVGEVTQDNNNKQPLSEEQLKQYEDYDSMLEDNRTIYDNVSYTNSLYASEQQVVNNVVVFIRFADESEDIYEKRGGYDYIKNQFIGSDNSLGAYIDEVSWGQVKVKTNFYPTDTNDNVICYVDDQPVNYYKKKSDSNPIGYESGQKSTRRNTLLNKVKVFMGADFEEKLGINNSLYNLTFIAPDEEEWNDLLWSHKSYTSINGRSQVYNFVTYPRRADKSRTLCHEFMHSLGYPDLYRYYNKTENPVSIWSVMASSGLKAGHPTVYEKQKYGKWIQNENAVKEITKNGSYSLVPSTSSQDNTLAFKIPVPESSTEYFMIEYRGGDKNSFDKSLGVEGLIIYRVKTTTTGNASGPPDEIFVLRNENGSVNNAYFDGSTGRNEFSNFKLYDSTENLGIRVYNIKKENGKMYFDIDLGREDKMATIYYQNSNFNQAYIHYQIGSGVWTTAPGIQMTRTTEKEGYNYKAIINMGKNFTLTTCFNNGNGSWDNNGGRNYTFSSGVYGCSNGTIVPLEKKLDIEEFSASTLVGGTYTPFYVNALATGGTAPYEYRFGYIFKGKEVVLSSFSSTNRIKYELSNAGDYTLFADVKDADGTEVRKTIDNFLVEGSKVNILETNVASPQKVGSEITITGDVANIIKDKYDFYRYTVTKDGETTVLVNNADKTATWIPTEAGRYTIKYAYTTYLGNVIEKSIQYEIQDKVANQTTIYYKGYSNPYIHYRVGNGSWTTAPGIKMEATTEQTGYTHKFTVDLGQASNLTACFNDGNGNWDNNGGRDYTFNTGVYGCSNSSVVTLEDSLRITKFTTSTLVGGSYIPFKMNALAAGGTGPYEYKFGYIDNGNEVDLTFFTPNNEVNCELYRVDEYSLYVDVKDAKGTTIRKTIHNFLVEGPKVSRLETNVASPQKVGTKIVITGDVTNLVKDNYDFYNYSVTKNGITTQLSNNADKTATWVPTEAGTYTITYQYITYLGKVIEKSIEYIIKDTEVNQTTIYYKGYSNPYIHYKIGNGNWTAVPGVKMIKTTEQAGYTHKITIDLGDATNLTTCFNDGNGNWDSRNGANYTFGTGNYLYSNGSIVKIAN